MSSLPAVNHLKANILELFLAGSETTSSTLWWAVYWLASNPDAQRAMQEEMDRVVGRGNTPTISHMDRCVSGAASTLTWSTWRSRVSLGVEYSVQVPFPSHLGMIMACTSRV